MINEKLFNPSGVVVVGGSDDVNKPGGAVLRNLLQSPFKGQTYVVNPKADSVQGVKSCHTVEELPQVDCAIIAIAAKYCLHAVEDVYKRQYRDWRAHRYATKRPGRRPRNCPI